MVHQVKAILPYKQEAINSLFKKIALRHVGRQSGYTHIIPIDRPVNDMTVMVRLE